MVTVTLVLAPADRLKEPLTARLGRWTPQTPDRVRSSDGRPLNSDA